MKKLMMVLCLCVGVCLPGFSQYIDENVYRGNMSLNQVLKTINNGFLPIHINDEGAFIDGGKATAKKAAQDRMKQEKNTYRTYYNAAVVYATSASFEGYDSYYPLRKDIAAQAIAYATKAIEINAAEAKKKGIAESPYMYLLRGEVRQDQSTFSKIATGQLIIKDREMAQNALKDYQKAAQLKPNIAPYADMSELAMVLGQKDLAKTYTTLQKEYDKVNNRKLVEAQAAKRKVQAKRRTKPKPGIDLWKAGISSHWRF